MCPTGFSVTNYSSIDILFLNTFLTSELRERDLSGCGTRIQLTDLTSKLEQVMQCFQGHWHQVKFGAAFLLQSPWQHSPVIAMDWLPAGHLVPPADSGTAVKPGHFCVLN